MNINDDIVLVYEKILNGEQKSFSPYFFQIEHRKEKIEILVRYLVENKLKISPEEALGVMTTDLLEEYKLGVILNYITKPVELGESDSRHIIYYAYPEIESPSVETLAINVYKLVLSGERRTFPKNYFKDGKYGEERAIACFKYLCHDLLGLTEEEVKEKFSTTEGLKFLAQYKLKIIMNILFFSAVDLLETVYEQNR